MSHSKKFLWRKYCKALPVSEWQAGNIQGYFLWLNTDLAQLPELTRYEGLAKAQLGFVSRDGARCHAVAYDLRLALEVLWKNHCKEFNAGIDAAEMMDLMHSYYFGIWMGDHTPYFVSDNEDLATVVGEFVSNHLD